MAMHGMAWLPGHQLAKQIRLTAQPCSALACPQGWFYVWTQEEIQEVLGEACHDFDLRGHDLMLKARLRAQRSHVTSHAVCCANPA